MVAMKWNDPACGDSCVNSWELNVWVNASSLATKVALEKHGTVLEDTCWLQLENNAQHRFSQTGRHAERHQLGSPVTWQDATHEN